MERIQIHSLYRKDRTQTMALDKSLSSMCCGVWGQSRWPLGALAFGDSACLSMSHTRQTFIEICSHNIQGISSQAPEIAIILLSQFKRQVQKPTDDKFAWNGTAPKWQGWGVSRPCLNLALRPSCQVTLPPAAHRGFLHRDKRSRSCN